MANMAELYFRLHLLERSDIYCVKIVMLNEKTSYINGPDPNFQLLHLSQFTV